MVERRNGAIVRDLTTKETETGNVYVVAPVPAACRPRSSHLADSQGRVGEAGVA